MAALAVFLAPVPVALADDLVVEAVFLAWVAVVLARVVVFLASAGDDSFFAVFLAAAGLVVLAFASFTGPEGPMHHSVSGGKHMGLMFDTATR